MNNYQITTDSGCDLSFDLCMARGVVPYKMPYTLDGVTYTDEMTEDSFRKFYDMLRAGGVATTTQINPSAFVSFWTPFAEAGTPVLHVSLAAAISGTYANALTAAEMLRQDYPDWECRIVDSANASAGLGLLVLRAADYRDNGYSLADNAGALESIAHNVNSIFTTDDLTSLYRGGRVGYVAAAFGTMLNIIPVMHLTYDGHLEVWKKTRGAAQCKNFIISAIRDLAIGAATQTLIVSDADAPEKAREFGEAIMREAGFRDIFYTHIGPVIGAHTGPGLISIFFIGRERD